MRSVAPLPSSLEKNAGAPSRLPEKISRGHPALSEQGSPILKLCSVGGTLALLAAHEVRLPGPRSGPASALASLRLARGQQQRSTRGRAESEPGTSIEAFRASEPRAHLTEER